MDILERLDKNVADLKRQQQQLRANLDAVSGAIQYAEGLKAELVAESQEPDEKEEANE